LPPGLTSNASARTGGPDRPADPTNRQVAPLAVLTRHERSAVRALLIRTLAAPGHAGSTDYLRHLISAAPMGALPAAAALHRVSGSVRRGLEGVDDVPSEVRQELAAVAQQSALHHLLTVGAMSQIGRAFDDAGLSWVVMKGPVVAAMLYPDVGDRTYADLDLLVDRRDFPLAMGILEDLGYRHTIHNWALAEQMLAGQVGMTSPSMSLDLHWHLHYSRDDRRPFALYPEEMIGRVRRVIVSGVNAPTLDPVDTLLTLAFHAARSDGHRLVWLKDVERALAVDQPDLDELVRRCEVYRCAPPVGLVLGRARALLGADVPDEILKATVPASLRTVDRLAVTLVHPVQLHERDTLTRLLTRSVRSSAATSLAAVPTRGVRQLRRSFFPPPVNETDSRDEKASYLSAVSASIDR
jgi:Uncharacterised nucleotidyltransferase